MRALLPFLPVLVVVVLAVVVLVVREARRDEAAVQAWALQRNATVDRERAVRRAVFDARSIRNPQTRARVVAALMAELEESA